MATTDSGYEATEWLLRRLEARLDKTYAEAARDVEAKLKAYLDGFAERDKKKRALVDEGKLSKKEYQKWRYGQICVGKRWREQLDVLSRDLANTDKIAMSIVNGYTPEVYAINANYGAYQVEHVGGINTGWTLYDRHTVERLVAEEPRLFPKPSVDIPKDKRWNRQHISNAITQGILQGESIDKVAKRLRSVTDMDRNAAKRNARTAVTGAQNAGRVASYKRAESMGVEVRQEWLAAHDGRTRESHAKIDGEQVAVGKTFSNGCRYPGDPNGAPEEVYNCRCTLIPALGSLGHFKGEFDEDLKKQDYEEWEAKRSGATAGDGYSTVGIAKPTRPIRSDFDSAEDYEAARFTYRAERDSYNLSISGVIERAESISRFNSVEDVEAWAKGNGILLEPGLFDSIDLRAMNETSIALDNMFKRFPEAKSYNFEYLDGSLQQKKFGIGIDNDGLLSANGGLNFNPKYFSNFSDGLKAAFEQQTDGTLVRGDGTFSSLVRHEYGHNVDAYIRSKISDEFHQSVDDWHKNFSTFKEYEAAKSAYWEKFDRYKTELRSLAGLSGSSDYSNTNELELFAEGFAAYASGEKTEFAKKFGEFLRRWY